MTVLCERDTTKPGNLCVKCGSTWAPGVPTPPCSAMTEAQFIPFESRKGEIVEEDGTVEHFRIPRSVFLDPVARDLAPNEPFFILRASDLLADYLVEQWAKNAESHGCNPKLVHAAREKAREMRGFGPRRYPT